MKPAADRSGPGRDGSYSRARRSVPQIAGTVEIRARHKVGNARAGVPGPVRRGNALVARTRALLEALDELVRVGD
jgi:hypothetical protein